MALDVDVLAEIREHVGSAPDGAAVELVYTRKQNAGVDDDKLVASTALSILRERRANLTIQATASSPNFSVPGEYSQNIGDPIKALDEKIAELEAATGEGAGGLTTAKLVRCDTGR